MAGGVNVADLGKAAQSTPGERPVVHNEVADAGKKKNFDEMIAEFIKDSPAKNHKKIYRGVF